MGVLSQDLCGLSSVLTCAKSQVAGPTQAAFLYALITLVGMTQAQAARVTQQNGI